MAESYFKSLMYGDMLNSPGYEVEFAVGLTYSLDLEALISVPISFGMLGDSEEVPLCCCVSFICCRKFYRLRQ